MQHEQKIAGRNTEYRARDLTALSLLLVGLIFIPCTSIAFDFNAEYMIELGTAVDDPSSNRSYHFDFGKV